MQASLFTSSHVSIIYIIHFIIFLNSHHVHSQLYHFCDGAFNFTANSTYQTNLNSLLNTLTNNSPTIGYSNATAGQLPEQAYGLAMCRGDVNASTCKSCLQTADRDALQICAYDKGSTIYYDNCMLRYSNQYFLSSFDNTNAILMWNSNNATDVVRFNELMNNLLNVTANYAAYNTTKKFATGEIGNYTKDNPKIYGLTQCTPDMSGDQCRECLQGMLNGNPSNQLNGKQGGRFVGVRCNFRYEIYKFFEVAPTLNLTVALDAAELAPTPTPSSEPTLTPSTPPFTLPAPPAQVLVNPAGVSPGGKKTSTGLVLAITVPLGIAALLIAAICLWRRKSTIKKPVTEVDDVSNTESLLFDLATIQTATSNFSDENKIGEGGFGEVYRGLLPDGREIAVKKLLASSIQGLGELKNELVLVAKLQHRNLVRLLGVCLQEEKLIIYEYVPNRSLDKFLFDSTRRHELRWETRHKIICGVARGLLYLHEESQLKIIHRDLKASNVLLDAEMNPKISDFGLARLCGGDQTQGNTSRIIGTHGYMAPEYAMHGHFSNKSDVFSFGVLVLEIISGRKNNGIFDSGRFADLLSYAWAKWNSGSIFDVLDPVIAEHNQRNEMLRCIHIALLCVHENPSNRPNMSEVSVMLSSNTVSLESPLRPEFVHRISSSPSVEHENKSESEGSESSGSRTKAVLVSTNDLSITELEPR